MKIGNSMKNRGKNGYYLIHRDIYNGVVEYCPPVAKGCIFLRQGDVKGYLQSCRAAENMTPEPLVLQQMACDIASGLLHLHKHNFTHR